MPMSLTVYRRPNIPFISAASRSELKYNHIIKAVCG